MEVHEQIIARRFVLVDENDKPAAYITGAELGFVGFHVQGPGVEGAPLVTVGLEAEGRSPVIRIRRPEGGMVYISVTETGEAGVYLVDADGTKRVISTT